MHIYDSLSQTKVLLKKPAKGTLNFFVCGPTVYNYSHIGHARTYVFFDTFVKYLRSTGIKVFYLQNITDIDDKIIARAKENNIKPLALARKFEKEYLKDLKSLGINSVSKYARATAFIPQIINQITNLVDKGYAYVIDDDGYYFDVSAFSDYGKLSKRTNEQAEENRSRHW
jgi:cysteinyl-tRNA synthetase